MAETCGVRPWDLYRGDPLAFSFDLAVLHTAAVEREKDLKAAQGKASDRWESLEARDDRRRAAVGVRG